MKISIDLSIQQVYDVIKKHVAETFNYNIFNNAYYRDIEQNFSILNNFFL